MKFSVLLRICAVGVMLLANSGCTSSHDDPPPEHSRRGSKETTGRKTKSSKEKKRRDPMNDMFFGIGKGAETPNFSNDSLSRKEQSIVREELRRQDDEMDLLRQRHRNYDSDRRKRQQWVYGVKSPDSK